MQSHEPLAVIIPHNLQIQEYVIPFSSIDQPILCLLGCLFFHVNLSSPQPAWENCLARGDRKEGMYHALDMSVFCNNLKSCVILGQSNHSNI